MAYAAQIRWAATLWVCACWLLLAGICALLVWPRLPRSLGQWLAFATLAPPVYLLLEYGCARVLGGNANRAGGLESWRPQRTSGRRIAILLLRYLILISVVVGTVIAIGKIVDAVRVAA
jgi:hypothetical protein